MVKVLMKIAIFLLATSYSVEAVNFHDIVLNKSNKYCPKGSTVFVDNRPETEYKLPQKSPNVTRIAFVGDSLTEGHGSTKDDQFLKEGHNGYLTNGVKDGNKGYPYLVWETLKKNNMTDKYEFLNFGFNGRYATEEANMMLEKDSNSYLQSCDFLKAVESEAQIYVVMLGINDILQDFDAIDKGDTIKHGYYKVVEALKNQKHKPEVYIMIPPPMIWQRMPKKGSDHHGAHLSTLWLPELIKDVAKVQQVKDDHIINLQEVITLKNASDYYVDFIHPNDKGYAVIGEKVYSTLFSKDKKK